MFKTSFNKQYISDNEQHFCSYVRVLLEVIQSVYLFIIIDWLIASPYFPPHDRLCLASKQPAVRVTQQT